MRAAFLQVAVAMLAVSLVVGCPGSDTKRPATNGSAAEEESDPRLECIASHAAPAGYEMVVRSLCAELHGLGGVGAAVAIARGDEIVFSTAVGLRCENGDTPLEPTDLMRIGSVTKTVIAALVLALAEGKDQLDEDLRPVLPEFEHPLTLRQLLMHTSGIRDPSPADVTSADDAWIQQIARTRINPGEHHYANASYAVVGLWLERTRKRSLRDIFATEKSVAPLRALMTFDIDGREDVSCGHESFLGSHAVPLEREPPVPSWTRPAGGGFSSAEQLARLPFALRRLDLVDTMAAATGAPDPEGWAYGLGVRVLQDGDQRVLAHSGNTGRFATELQWSPERNISVAILSNTRHAYKATLAAAWEATE